MKRSVALLAALSGAVLLTGSACSSGDDPGPNYSSASPTPTTSTSPTPTESPSPTGVPSTGPNVNPGEAAPTEPSVATQETKEGALAFVTYYVKTLDWVYATSRPDLLSQFFENPPCTTCASGQEFIEKLVALGEIAGGRVDVHQIGFVTNDGRGGATYAVSVNISVAAAQVVTSSGATATSFPATPNVTLTEWVAWNGRWTIVEERYA